MQMFKKDSCFSNSYLIKIHPKSLSNLEVQSQFETQKGYASTSV